MATQITIKQDMICRHIIHKVILKQVLGKEWPGFLVLSRLGLFRKERISCDVCGIAKMF